MSEEIQEFLQWAEAQGLIPTADQVMQDRTFMIASVRMAVWACEVIEQAEAEAQRRARECAQQIDDWTAWAEEAKRTAVAKRAWFEGHLETYLRAEQASGRLGEKKSLSLPGKRRLQFRKHAVDYEVTDYAQFLEWCRTHGLIKETWQWGEAKQRLIPAYDQVGAGVLEEVIDEETGDIGYAPVPGVIVSRQGGEGFSVTLATDEPAADAGITSTKEGTP
jgi:hypothetical protein